MRQHCGMMVEQADAALVQSIRDMSDQIVQIHPQGQIIPAEMGSENHGAVYAGFKEIGKISAQNPRFTVKLDKERAVMLYVGR